MSASDHTCHVCQTIATMAPEKLILDDGTWLVYNVADVPGGIAFYTETIGLVQNHTRINWLEVVALTS